MNTQKVYGPPIKWHGGERPVSPETMVKIKLRSGRVTGPFFAVHCEWKHNNYHADIVEYCTITEQTDLEAAEQLLRDNGYTVTKPLTFEDVVPMTEAPEIGTRYWIVSATDRDGAYSVPFGNDATDRLIIQRRMAYLDKEHALIAARHIFGLKGGEL